MWGVGVPRGAVWALVALVLALAFGDLASTIAKVAWRSTSYWRDDFGGQLDASLWCADPPKPLVPTDPDRESAAGGAPEPSAELPGGAAVGGYLRVSGHGVRLRHVLYPPLRIRARVGDTDGGHKGLEYVISLTPLQNGQLYLAPGWRCDEDPYLELPPSEAAARLASWPGGRACFWNCSESPLTRTVEIAMDGEGVVSLADDAGCGKSAVTRVGMPVRVALGCRVAARPDFGAEFPHGGSGRESRLCPPERAALFDWIEVHAQSSELDPGLEPRLLEGASILPMLRRAGEGLLSRVR